MVRPPPTPYPLAAKAEPQNIVIDLTRTAVIVIDMQNDFCSPHGWLSHMGVDVTPARTPIAPLQSLLPRLRGKGVPVLWVNWGNRPDRLNLSPSLLHVYNPTGTASAWAIRCPARLDRPPERRFWNATVGPPPSWMA